ncbi:MAG: ankyrin repeat domain-containing protein [Acidobacteriia bacterium]|nr:ankyrin repeat domain-containing protein [Terriglobia bacterium]
MKSALILAIEFAAVLGAQVPDFTPPTPLIAAVMHNNTEEAKRLLAAGADPNEARLVGFPAVFFPVAFRNAELFHAMVAKGADVQARDASGSTALMWAAFNEAGDPALAEELLQLGVDPNAKNQVGETALIWASRRGNTKVVAALERAGASNPDGVRDSVQRAIALLQKTSPQFIRVSGCVSCHNQSLPQMAAAAARAHGIVVDEKSSRLATESTIAVVKPLMEDAEKSADRVPDPSVSVSYLLLGLAADNYPADAYTKAMARLVARWQMEDGGFRVLPLRPPIESSHFTATALSLRALQLYGEHPQDQVARARAWLLSAKPETTEDRAMQVLGLAWSNAEPKEIRERAQALLAEQREDGGWSQLPALGTDAYATGQALVALQRGAKLPASDPAIQRGIAFLLRTQFADGSWLVRTRSFPFQPYKESGFPYGKDQWISAAGTSWAAMALSLALPVQQEEPRVLYAVRSSGE